MQGGMGIDFDSFKECIFLSDIPYKCKGLSWKLGNFNLLVVLLDCHLHFQLHDAMELSR